MKKLFFSSLILLVLGSAVVHAQTQGNNLGYSPLEPIPGITTGANGSAIDFPTLLGNLYKILFTIGALFSVLMLTVSGVRYMLSDIVTSKEKARQRIKACLYGLLLLAASYLILYTVNPQLLRFTLQPGTATVNTPAPIPPTAGSATASANPNQTAGPPCGNDAQYANGCPANTYCGSITTSVNFGTEQINNCLPNTNKAAQQDCSAESGTWYASVSGNYCYLPQYNTQQSCLANEGTWTSNWIRSNYCYKQ